TSLPSLLIYIFERRVSHPSTNRSIYRPSSTGAICTHARRRSIEMATSSSGNTTVTLRSSDGEEFVVQADTIAAASVLIKNMLEEGCAAGAIPLTQVTGRILARVVDYCNRHYADADAAAYVVKTTFSSGDPDLDRFDTDFVSGVDQDTLFDLLLAANYLEVQGLLDLACKTVADQMRGKTVEGMRAHFNILNDYTKEEEAQVRSEVAWAFE
uniref:SKP1-like protein n=5 Tax=Triticinae TaxID=1648030 RepID=A0A453DZN7_AEGTS